MLSRLAMLLRLSDCLFFTFRCQPALVRVLVTLCASAMTSFRRWSWSLCLTQLAPAYGVTSICRFVQAATTLPIILMSLSRPHLPPLVSLVSPIFRCHLQSLNLLSCFVRHHSSALRPVFTQLAHTAALFYPVPLVFCGRRGIRTPDVPRFMKHLHVLTFCFRPLSHPSEKSDYSHEPSDYTI